MGDYPDDRKGAERVLLARMQRGLVGSVPPRDLLGEGESTLEEISEYFSDYGENYVRRAARSLVSVLYSVTGGEEWSRVVEAEKGRENVAVSVRGVSLDVEGAWWT